eukprot:COSAG01_NODE_241_length_20597_cov_8.200751_2_plen_355_part_00
MSASQYSSYSRPRWKGEFEPAVLNHCSGNSSRARCDGVSCTAITFHQPKRDNTPIPQPIPQNSQSNHDVCVCACACARSCHKHPAAHLRIVRRVLPVHVMHAERHVLVEQGATLSAPGPRNGGVGQLLREEQAIAGPALQPPQRYLWWPAPANTHGRAAGLSSQMCKPACQLAERDRDAAPHQRPSSSSTGALHCGRSALENGGAGHSKSRRWLPGMHPNPPVPGSTSMSSYTQVMWCAAGPPWTPPPTELRPGMVWPASSCHGHAGATCKLSWSSRQRPRCSGATSSGTCSHSGSPRISSKMGDMLGGSMSSRNAVVLKCPPAPQIGSSIQPGCGAKDLPARAPCEGCSAPLS